jgi:hypothetical protein
MWTVQSGGWFLAALLACSLGLPLDAQTPPPGPAAAEETELVGPPDPRLERPPELALDPAIPDPALVVDQSLEALLGRTAKDYILPSPEAVLRAILGFVLVLSLAFVAGHPRVAQIERSLGIAHVATTGLPFVLLGLIAAQPSVGVLSPAVLMEINPLLTFGLGWIGFGVGSRFDASLIQRLPPGAASVLGYTTLLPLAGVAAVCGAAMLGLEPGALDGGLARDALLLGAAGALTARSAPHLWRPRGFSDHDIERMQTLVHLERIIGVGALLAIAAYFRPEGAVVAWRLPGTAWLFLAVGVGFALGAVLLALLSSIREPSESLPLYLGGIAFAAGMARYLRLSSLAVCCLAGVLLAAFPGPWKQKVDEWNESFERPIYFLFLTIAGALWRPSDWRGWALMAVFVAARLGFKWLGAFLLARRGVYSEARREREWLTFAPAGAISLAIVVNAQNLFLGPHVSWIVTSVIAGSLVSEVIVQAVLRRGAAEA